MGEHAEKNAPGGEAADGTKANVPGGSVSTYQNPDNADEPKPKPKRSVDWMSVKDQVVALLAGLVRWVGLICALILVLHIVFVIGEANADNSIVSWVSGWSDGLSLGFHDLFQPSDPKLSVLVNYGIAAIFWLVASSLAARIIRRVGGVTV